MKGILRRSVIGLAAVAMGAVTFAAPASAGSSPGPCTAMAQVIRGGKAIEVPTAKGSVTCQIGRALAANEKIVAQFQATLKVCYPKLNLARPYSDEKVGNLDADGSFGPRTEAALKAVQAHIGTDADGIYGPNTRNRMKFRVAPSGHTCHAY